MAGELVEFQEGTIGIALNLESTNVGVVLMGDGLLIQEGSSVKATGRIAQILLSEAYLGRVIKALANLLMVERIISRRSVYEPLQTGLIAIDSMIPIGCGQGELIIGDRQTGKTTVATTPDPEMWIIQVTLAWRNPPIRTEIQLSIHSWDPGGRGDHRGSSLLENPYIPYQCMDSYLSSTGLGSASMEK
ncbi:hypothetical protein R6Q57_024323 [Mikania cordata]